MCTNVKLFQLANEMLNLTELSNNDLIRALCIAKVLELLVRYYHK